MKKKYLIIILFFINLSCKKEEKTIDQKFVISNQNVQPKVIDSVKVEKDSNSNTCLTLINELIKTSSIQNPFKKTLNVEIDDNNGVYMKLRLFNKELEQENTIGWVIFDAENMRLLDITNDIENPTKLTFNNQLWNKVIKCSFSDNKSYYLEDDNIKLKKENCKTITKDMETIEECTFENTTIIEVYKKIILEKVLEDSDFLLKSLPNVSQNLEINKNGLMNIEYKIASNKVEVTINYEGGVNIIEIQQIKNKSIRKIIHSAG